MDKSLAIDLPDHDFSSPGSTNKHVVVVMDGMTEFTTDTLQWALDNVVTAGCIVTLLGVMPWLNIPLFLKTRNVFWTEELEDAHPDPVKEKNGCGNDVKCLKRQAVIDLCRKYGVVLQKKIVMGYPLRLLVVEQVATLSPTWVVFDGSHKRNKDFYAKKIPCNIFMINGDGRVDMIKSMRMTDIPRELAPSTPQMTVSEESKNK
ncbi:uncharacterized protein LOC114915992 [Cajanus cajan]|uniref:Uncharacterized protein n=1 Tax=Cajanus cajan TaxID=3821 RepID=A0A151TH80_CAJCA|nr:uncharacterized protein LOC114915992 [Cajanus cajan]KYP66410.1 hypothetical protein KK1_012703 [Cajanus cajan]